MSEEKVYTIAEVCHILQISADTAYKLLNDGTLIGFRIGSRWRISHPDLMRYIETQVKQGKRR